jgi:hypothetical protein
VAPGKKKHAGLGMVDAEMTYIMVGPYRPATAVIGITAFSQVICAFP